MNFIVKILATGLGTGFFPKAPGTVGSLLTLLAYYQFFPAEPSLLIHFIFFIIIVAVFLTGVWVSGEAEKFYGHDPSCVVIDEIVGMGITLLLLPKIWYLMLAGFLLFRLIDITKWFGVDRMQQLKGGWGVMMDDILAGVWSNLLLQMIVLMIKK
jgi:phosphatidylglycerophosphatase A